MSPYEIEQPGGSVEHWNAESGRVWLTRVLRHFRKFAWLNPSPQERWRHTHSIGLTRDMVDGRMYPLTLQGLGEAIGALS